MAIGVLQDGMPKFRSAYDIGGEIGESIGSIAGAVGKGFAERKTEQNKAKVDQYLMEYNSRTGAFQGLDDVMATKKLSRLLMPLDPNLAERYMVRATELENQSAKFGQEKELANIKGANALELFGQKAQVTVAKTQAQQEALNAVDKASAEWYANPEDPKLQGSLRSAINKAKATGVNVENPIDDYLTKQRTESNQGFREKQFEQQVEKSEWERLQDERRSKLDERRFQLDIKRLEEETKARADKLSQGSKLGSETVGKIANLEAVLDNVAEIKALVNEIEGPWDIKRIRDLKASADLAVEFLGRVQSGGAINKEENSSFRGLVSPSVIDFADGGATYLRNIGKLEKAIQNKIQQFATEGRNITGGAQPSHPQSEVQGYKPQRPWGQ